MPALAVSTRTGNDRFRGVRTLLPAHSLSGRTGRELAIAVAR